eukprot:symbB.v1.2.025875.t1/scaffold2471.1/size78466/1
MSGNRPGIELAKQQRKDRRSLNAVLPLVSTNSASIDEIQEAFIDYAFHEIILQNPDFFQKKDTPAELRYGAPKGVKEMEQKKRKSNIFLMKQSSAESERLEPQEKVSIEVKPKLAEEQMLAELPLLLAEAEQLQAERDELLKRLEEKEEDIEWLQEIIEQDEAEEVTKPAEAPQVAPISVEQRPELEDVAIDAGGSRLCRNYGWCWGSQQPPFRRGWLRWCLEMDSVTASTGRATWMAGKMQMMHNGSFPSSQLFHSKSTVLGMSRSDWSETSGYRPGKAKSWANLRKAQALDRLIAEVRNLGGDAPIKGDGNSDLPPKNSHEALLIRLKSRAARLEAEKHRDFISSYWQSMYDNEDSTLSDAHLDSLLTGLEKKSEELKQRSEELQLEAKEAERRLEHVNSLNLGRASDLELQAMNAFERSQRRIQEDKREEEYQKQRDEVQALFAKVHRRLQSELIELRDYKVLLREYRRVRLEKLSETLGKDGRRLRHCVRVMIRNGAQRILQRLESAKLPLEPWMREVLLNCCYVEIRIEDTEVKLLTLRRQALKPVKDEVLKMMSKTKAERFEDIFVRTLDQRNQKLGLASTVGSSCNSERASQAEMMSPQASSPPSPSAMSRDSSMRRQREPSNSSFGSEKPKARRN